MSPAIPRVFNSNVLESSISDPEKSVELVFCCPRCGRKLSVSHRLAGVSGPCPSCGTVIVAPAHTDTVQMAAVVMVEPAVRRSSAVQGKQHAPRRSRGHIIADSMVDRQHLDRRETAKTLFIITMFILAICACLLVSWFLNVWVKK
ncbi:MAG: hypothetical protein V4689_06655 [Verrucomicrobiota bacterium]